MRRILGERSEVMLATRKAKGLGLPVRVVCPLEHGVFCLPGSVVKMKGYLRASLTANEQMIERALPIFAKARRSVAALVTDVR